MSEFNKIKVIITLVNNEKLTINVKYEVEFHNFLNSLNDGKKFVSLGNVYIKISEIIYIYIIKLTNDLEVKDE